MKFKKYEGAQHIGEAISMISHNDLDVALIKQVMPAEDCALIEHHFFNSSDRRKRPDSVPGYILGATHYGKSPDDYFRQCGSSRGAVAQFFEDAPDPMRMVHEAIAQAARRPVRPSRFGDQQALHARIVEWLPKTSMPDDFLLLPHEDYSQVNCDRNEHWELRHARNITAINFYASSSAGAGCLRIYDYVPDAATRDELNLQGSGYPYPLDLLQGKSYVELAVETGDLAVINGRYVHAVTPSPSRRVVVNCFLTLTPEGEYVYWT
ncbi:hypothetical protein ACEN9F_00045 [Duganella sp. CT11-25]|uniref:2OG-Fe(II)-dependent halogenase WelO5 family protein n=1 Tax=unclassified Duganella TaxID=2636909 RepID=UPI0039B0FABF